MRRTLVVALLLISAGFNTMVSRVVPLTTKDVCLMLRAGYSTDAIQRDLTSRHFVGSFDAAAEKSLREAGAAPALVNALKSGSYLVSPEDARIAQDEIAAQARRRAFEVEQSRKFNTLYQDQLRRSRAAGYPQTAASSVLLDPMKGDLVSWRNGSLSKFDDGALGKVSLIALYSSARWCGPCQAFTPRLVEFYKRVSPQHPEFEIIFLSHDRSPGEMEKYMREAQMPWPAIDFDKLPSKAALKKYEGSGIPCLVVLDSSGKVVSDSYAGKTYLGAEKVLKDLESIFAKDSAAVAASH